MEQESPTTFSSPPLQKIIQLQNLCKNSSLLSNTSHIHITVSSVFGDALTAAYSATGAPINNTEAWVPKTLPNSWICRETTDGAHLITGVVIQGRPTYDQWATKFSLSYSLDGIIWEQLGEFVGTYDRNTVIRRDLKEPVRAAFMKFTILEYSGHPAMRCDVYGI